QRPPAQSWSQFSGPAGAAGRVAGRAPPAAGPQIAPIRCEDPVTRARAPASPPRDDLHSAAMTPSVRADAGGGASSAPETSASSTALRIAVLDRDSGFIQVLCKRLDRLRW